MPKYTYREALGIPPDDTSIPSEVESEARALLSGELPLEEWLKQEQ